MRWFPIETRRLFWRVSTISAQLRCIRLAVAFALVLAGAAQAHSPETCLARQLGRLGVETGSDWPQLRQAATQFAATQNDIDLPDLTPQSALTWCRELGVWKPLLRASWPSAKRRVIVVDGDGDKDVDLLLSSERRVRELVHDVYGLRFAGQFALVAARNDAGLRQVINEGLAQMSQRPINLGDRYARYCSETRIGGLAGRGFIALCWPDVDAETPGYDDFLSVGVLPVVAHEFMHQVQYELAADTPPRLRADGTLLLGPEWMVEGSAEFLELQFTSTPTLVEGPAFFNLQTPARRSRKTLEDLRENGSVASRSDYHVARFAALLLAQKHGGRALFDYFDALGRFGDQGLAFQSVFGEDMATFEARFEDLRRDYGAASAYGIE